MNTLRILGLPVAFALLTSALMGSAARTRSSGDSILNFSELGITGQFGVRDNSVSVRHDNSVSVRHDNSVSRGQFGVSSSLSLPLHQVGKLDSEDNSVSRTIRCQFIIIASLEGQFGVSSSLSLPLH